MSIPISALRMQVAPNIENGARVAQTMPNLQNPSVGAGIEQSQPGTESFSDLLSNFVSGVNEQQHAAGDAQTALMRGEDIELHDVMIQMEQASLSTDLLLEMRNRLVAAVNDLTRMPM